MNILYILLLSIFMNTSGTTNVSYYAESINGRKTASGEIFYTDSLTCASPTLPFGTLIKLTNTENDKEVIVRVNDRGPWKNINGRRMPHPNRGFDISKSAFEMLADPNKGVVKVEYQVLTEK